MLEKYTNTSFSYIRANDIQHLTPPSIRRFYSVGNHFLEKQNKRKFGS